MCTSTTCGTYNNMEATNVLFRVFRSQVAPEFRAVVVSVQDKMTRWRNAITRTLKSARSGSVQGVPRARQVCLYSIPKTSVKSIRESEEYWEPWILTKYVIALTEVSSPHWISAPGAGGISRDRDHDLMYEEHKRNSSRNAIINTSSLTGGKSRLWCCIGLPFRSSHVYDVHQASNHLPTSTPCCPPRISQLVDCSRIS